MLAHYLALELPASASEEEIRERYLQLVRRHTPERDPERFQRISKAYEALKDRRSRVRESLFGDAEIGDFKLALEALAEAPPDRRRTPGLGALLAIEGKATGGGDERAR